VDALRQGLRELGYIEGQHIAFEFRFAAGQDERLRELALELKQRKMDVLVVAGGSAAASCCALAAESAFFIAVVSSSG